MRSSILANIAAYLNHRLTLGELVDWAEMTLVEPDIPDHEDANLIMDILAYIGAADTRGFPLTWDILSDFVKRLGGTIRVVVETV